MNVEEIREYCIAKPATEECFPFDDVTLVFKVAGKMFALLNLEHPHSVNLKCDPERAIELRETYPFIVPGFHMNKTHWNTVHLDNEAPSALIREMIDASFALVCKSLTRKARLENGLE